MNRCLNDLFAYCSNEPHPVESTETSTSYNYRGQPVLIEITVTRCLRDSKTCPHCTTFTKSLQLSHTR